MNLNDELAVLGAMLTGWSRQQPRMPAEHTIDGRERLVRGDNAPPLDVRTDSQQANKACNEYRVSANRSGGRLWSMVPMEPRDEGRPGEGGAT